MKSPKSEKDRKDKLTVKAITDVAADIRSSNRIGPSSKTRGRLPDPFAQ